jgi:chemotaxis regulatin CheY-phosphate phosphatase CheZ
MNSLCVNIRQLISTLDTTMITNQGHFLDYQTRMVELLRQMAMIIQEINHSDNIHHLANKLTSEYKELIHATYGAIGTSITNELATRIKNVVKDLGLIIIELIAKLEENYSKSDLENFCQKVIEKVMGFLFQSK